MAQKKANETTAHDAMAAALAVSRKILPGLSERNALDEMERMVALVLEKLIDEPRIVVCVNDEFCEPLAARIGLIPMSDTLKGKLVVQGDNSVPVGDCRIEWSCGGADRDMNVLWREIDDIIERNFGNVMELGGGAAGNDQPVAPENVESSGKPETVDPNAGNDTSSVGFEKMPEEIPEHDVDGVSMENEGA